MAALHLNYITDVNDPDYEVIEFHGDLDKSTLQGTEAEVGKALEQFQGRAFIFDLSDLNFLNSEGIGFLVSVHSKLKKRGKELLVASPKPNVNDIFHLIGLPKIIPVLENIASAISYVKK